MRGVRLGSLVPPNNDVRLTKNIQRNEDWLRESVLVLRLTLKRSAIQIPTDAIEGQDVRLSTRPDRRTGADPLPDDVSFGISVNHALDPEIHALHH